MSNCLQAKTTDLAVMSRSLASLYNSLELLQKNWDGLLETARTQAKFAGADTTLELAIRRSLYCYSGRVCGQNLEEMSREQIFQSSVFVPSVQACIKQAKLRFAGHSTIVDSFNCITPSGIRRETNEELTKAAKQLSQLYKHDLTVDFGAQLVSLKVDFGDNLTDCKGPSDLLEFIMGRELATLYPEVVTALVLFLTIPVTVASAERSFSKLKLIKNYLRSTMSNDILSSFAVISIENCTARQLKKKELAKLFALSKPKRAARFGI